MSSPAKEVGSGLRLALDLGPLLIFFVANAWYGPFIATAMFMVAIVVAIGVSLAITGRVSMLQLFSGGLVLVMGALTVWLQNETFIKIKPTIYYGIVTALLTFGLMTGKPLLKLALGSAYPGLSDEGWRKLTRNWAIFFAFMALVNEAVWRNTSTDFWIGFKLWGALPITFLFAAANIPMLLRHGLTQEQAPALATEEATAE